MSSAYELYAVFEGTDKKTRKFLGYTRAYTERGAANNLASRKGRSIEGLAAELATRELDAELKKKKSKARPSIWWEVEDLNGVKIGSPTQAVSAEEAKTNVWFGLVRPDTRHPSDGEKAYRREELVAKPLYGQASPKQSQPRKKKRKLTKGGLFAKSK